MDVSSIGASEALMLNKLQMGQVITANPISESDISEKLALNAPRADSPLAFSAPLKGVLDKVNGLQVQAEQKINAVELGESTDMIGATIAAQKAQLSFSALMQVRNKMVSNFNDIIKMPL